MIGYQGCFVARVVDLIAAHGQAGTILLLLLGANISADLAVCGPFVGGDLRFLYEETLVFCPFCSSIPWKKCPILFVKLVSHKVFVAGFLTRWQYSRTVPVSSPMMVPIKWFTASLLSASWCIVNVYPMAGGVPAAVVTGLGIR